jgi:hypothetical protein
MRNDEDYVMDVQGIAIAIIDLNNPPSGCTESMQLFYQDLKYSVEEKYYKRQIFWLLAI